MARGDKRWIAVLGAVALGGAVAVYYFGRDSRDRGAPGQQGDDDSRSRWRGFQAGQPSLPSGTDAGGDGPAAPLPGSGDPTAPVPVEAIMGSWRHAIINKDADTVLSSDRIFAADRDRFMKPLVTSAETDSEDRVRAFSTRVLGKYRAPELVDVFVRLLGDKGEHVRGNAAWSLGELASDPTGRQAARKTLPTLRRIEKQDRSPDARAAAALAVKKLM